MDKSVNNHRTLIQKFKRKYVCLENVWGKQYDQQQALPKRQAKEWWQLALGPETGPPSSPGPRRHVIIDHAVSLVIPLNLHPNNQKKAQAHLFLPFPFWP